MIGTVNIRKVIKSKTYKVGSIYLCHIDADVYAVLITDPSENLVYSCANVCSGISKKASMLMLRKVYKRNNDLLMKCKMIDNIRFW